MDVRMDSGDTICSPNIENGGGIKNHPRIIIKHAFFTCLMILSLNFDKTPFGYFVLCPLKAS